MAAGDIYEMSLDMTWQAQAIMNRYHFVQIGSDGTGDARTSVAQNWDTFFRPFFLALISDEITVTQSRVRRVLPVQTQQLVTAEGVAGMVAGDVLPTNCVAILRLYGVLAGRKGVGFMKIPGVATAFVNEGRINSSYEGTAEIFGAPFEVDQTHGGTGYVFRSCVLGTDDVARQVQTARATSRIKQLRSRTIGQGV